MSVRGSSGVGRPDWDRGDQSIDGARGGAGEQAAEAKIVRGSTPKASQALATAIQNDARGTVDVKDARSIVASALGEIAKAKDPEKALASLGKTIDSARALATSSAAKKVLDGFAGEAAKAVDARRAELAGGKAVLPTRARDELVAILSDAIPTPRGTRAELRDVKGSEKDGFEVTWKAGGKTGTAHVMKLGDGFFYAPEKVDRKTLEKATAEFQSYFDEHFKQDMLDNGASRAEVAAARKAIVPERALFPGEDDPIGFSEDFPVVLVLANETGSDHGFYAGVDPKSGEVAVDAFN